MGNFETIGNPARTISYVDDDVIRVYYSVMFLYYAACIGYIKSFFT